jgi:LysM repeat protein
LVALEEPASSKKAATPATEAETASETTAEPPVRIAKQTKDQEPTFDFSEIDRQIKAGQVVEAHKALSKLFWQQPDLRSSVQERIDLTAKAIYFSPQPHVQEPHVVQAGDQLRKIATTHHVPWQYLARLNRVDPKRLREGQKLKVIDGPFGAVVTLSNFELTLHHGGQYVRSYPCCIGKNNATPVGKFKVLNKVTNPQYTDPNGKVFASGDPKNPLGAYWLDLGESYGIHGTIEPDSIGKAESRGCVRLLNVDVAEVYELLDLAAEVVIRP